MRRTLRTMRQPLRLAFTLLELMACLALSAIIAALAVVSLRGLSQPAKMNAVSAQIAAFDAATRRFARQSDRPALLEIDQDHELLSVASTFGDRAPLHLPDGYRFDSLRIANGASDAASIRFASDGRSATYAIVLDGPAGEKHWIIVAGLTGQVIEGDRLSDCDAFMAALAGRST